MNTQRGEREAAREVLAVSERSLQNFRQKGSATVASNSDRSVFQVPDYKALPWPVVSGPDITLEHDVNNKYLGRASIGAADFAEPFTGAGASGRQDLTKPAFGSPGLEFSGSANLQETEKVSFVGSEAPRPALYQQLASSIKMDFEGITPAGSATALGSMAQSYLGSSLGSPEPQQPRPLARNVGVYGDEARKQPRSRIEEDLMMQRPARPLHHRLLRALQGCLYDSLHYSEITDVHLKTAGCKSKVVYVFLRDGRGPYLLLLMLLLILIVMLFMKLLSK
jgi:hypothetical protein